jgi:hypothetical protein
MNPLNETHNCKGEIYSNLQSFQNVSSNAYRGRWIVVSVAVAGKNAPKEKAKFLGLVANNALDSPERMNMSPVIRIY